MKRVLLYIVSLVLLCLYVVSCSNPTTHNSSSKSSNSSEYAEVLLKQGDFEVIKLNNATLSIDANGAALEDYLSEGVFAFKGRLLNDKFEDLIKQDYESASPLGNNYYILYANNGNTMLLYKNDKQVADLSNENISTIRYYSDGRAVITANDKYGCIDENGRLAIKPILLYLSDFTDGCALAVDESRNVFLVDKDGNIIKDIEHYAIEIGPLKNNSHHQPEIYFWLYDNDTKEYKVMKQDGEIIINPLDSYFGVTPEFRIDDNDFIVYTVYRKASNADYYEYIYLTYDISGTLIGEFSGDELEKIIDGKNNAYLRSVRRVEGNMWYNEFGYSDNNGQMKTDYIYTVLKDFPNKAEFVCGVKVTESQNINDAPKTIINVLDKNMDVKFEYLLNDLAAAEDLNIENVGVNTEYSEYGICALITFPNRNSEGSYTASNSNWYLIIHSPTFTGSIQG